MQHSKDKFEEFVTNSNRSLHDDVKMHIAPTNILSSKMFKKKLRNISQVHDNW